ncbi:hypothetical protein PROFUN_05981 [Planoprotostelium fungivorum]|uniref:Uncharacterized protein n=1 Tax=Planoprotostelium fungivorum TaxID=1890364 RepID=A0A2P6NPB5_9EUKA|nr:hypothetical protein PROFUN_05981 [Planoprotostelium fungivorum]
MSGFIVEWALVCSELKDGSTSGVQWTVLPAFLSMALNSG